jgi:hypothetical protein
MKVFAPPSTGYGAMGLSHGYGPAHDLHVYGLDNTIEH